MNGIQVHGLSKSFGERIAVEALHFEVQPGEVFGLLGPNGAGKTTTVRMLTGLLQPTQGDAQVWGHSVRNAGESLRRTVGLLTEQPGLYERLSAKENLRFFMKLHELNEAVAWPRAEAYLRRFDLWGRAEEPCGSFSKGMRQKLAIVRTLLHEPQVIFLDEPTSGLDPEAARTVRDAIAELAAEGRTLVLCSHNLAEVEQLCRRVAIVRRRILALAPLKDLRRAGTSLVLQLEGDAARFVPVLTSLPFQTRSKAEGAKLHVYLPSEDDAPEVVRALVQAGARIHAAVPSVRPLEEVYLELIRASEA